MQMHRRRFFTTVGTTAVVASGFPAFVRSQNTTALQRREWDITGANLGIGYESARQLSGRGFHVVVGARSERVGKEAVSKLESIGKITTNQKLRLLPRDVTRGAVSFV